MLSYLDTHSYYVEPGKFNLLTVYREDMKGRAALTKACEKTYMLRLKKVLGKLLQKQFYTPFKHDATVLKVYGRFSHASASDRPLVFEELMFRITLLASRYFDPSVGSSEEKISMGDKILGRALFHVAAEGGMAEAIYRLGFSFEKGEGGPQNSSLAKSLYHLALQKGHLGAYYSLEALGNLPAGCQPPSGSIVPFMSMDTEGVLTIHHPPSTSTYDFQYLNKSDFLNIV